MKQHFPFLISWKIPNTDKLTEKFKGIYYKTCIGKGQSNLEGNTDKTFIPLSPYQTLCEHYSKWKRYGDIVEKYTDMIKDCQETHGGLPLGISDEYKLIEKICEDNLCLMASDVSPKICNQRGTKNLCLYCYLCSSAVAV